MAKRVVRLAVAVAWALLGVSVRAQESAIDRALAAEYFDQARRLSEADGGRLWGVPLYGPMLLADPATQTVVANQADGEGMLRAEGGLFVGTLPDEVGIANTATRWAGVGWTMIMWTALPEAPYARGRLMMHECFHRIQDEIGLPGLNPGNNHLDSRDGRIWLQMEWRALSEALIRSGAERERAAEDALVFRACRRALFPSGAEEERALEINEGLAEYTGYRLCGLPESVLPDRAAMRLDQQPGTGGGFVRNFAYVSGPAYGLLLDELNPQWRKPEGRRRPGLAARRCAWVSSSGRSGGRSGSAL